MKDAVLSMYIYSYMFVFLAKCDEAK